MLRPSRSGITPQINRELRSHPFSASLQQGTILNHYQNNSAYVLLTFLKDVNEIGDGTGILCPFMFTGISRYTGFLS